MVLPTMPACARAPFPSSLRCLTNLDDAYTILEKQYEECEVVKLDTQGLKKDSTSLSEMAKNEFLAVKSIVLSLVMADAHTKTPC